MKHYIKLYFTIAACSIKKRLEYKQDLFIGIFGFLAQNLASILSIFFIINSIPSLEGWTMWQMGFLYGFTMLPISLDHLFTDELWRVAYFRVRNGDMDRYFLRPAPILFQVISETVQLEALGEMIVGIVMLVICGLNCNIQWSFSLIIMIITATLFGAIIVTAIKILTAAPAFVMKKSGFLMQILYNFRDYTKYPVSIYPGAIRCLLTFVFPFALFISIPVETVLFQNHNPWLLDLRIIASSIVMMAIAIPFWNFFVRRYESSGN